MGSCFSQEPEVDYDGPVDFNHFQILRAIGKGAFGKVCIVKKKDTKQMYALKYMNKIQMIHKHAVENVFREIRILRNLEHPFLVNLWFTFHDREDIFMVLDLMLGGDINYHLEKAGRFSVERVRLYMAELALALDYLRSRHIIHRDIKPANMLLDSQGHVHLTDFNVATVVRANYPITSTTGTKPYMAPEVLQTSSRGYSYPVDWWGLGVSAYEMLRGTRPFVMEKHMSTSAMHALLTKTRPSASASWDRDTCDILKVLLHPDEDKRLQSAATLKLHPFFQGLKWEEVEQKKSTPPFVPPQNRINCDPTHELEEMIVEPNPLHKKQHRLSKRNQRTEDEAVEKELAKIDEKFKVYNRQRESDKTTIAKEEAKKPLDESTESGTQAEELTSGSHGGEGAESASKTSRSSGEVGEVVGDKHLVVSAPAWSEGDDHKPSAKEEGKDDGKGGAAVEERAISLVEVEVGVEAESPSRVDKDAEETKPSSSSKLGVEKQESDGPPRNKDIDVAIHPTVDAAAPGIGPSDGDQNQHVGRDTETQPQVPSVDSAKQGGIPDAVAQGNVEVVADSPSSTLEDAHDSELVQEANREAENSDAGGKTVEELTAGERDSNSENVRSELDKALKQDVEVEGGALGTAGLLVQPDQNGVAVTDALPE